MSYEAQAKTFEENIRLNSTNEPMQPSGFSENYIMGIGETIDENLSISEWIVRESGGWSYDDRDEELRNLRKSGAITDDEWMAFTRVYGRSNTKQTNYSELAVYANQKLGTRIQTNQEIDDNMREGLKQRREMREDVFMRQSTAGAAGQFVGSMHGYAWEPFNLVAMAAEPIVLGKHAYTISQATTRIGRGLHTAKYVAMTNAGVEAALQPALFNWHEEIGVDMDWGDALTNIISVAAMSGAISGVVSGARTKKRFKAEQVGMTMALDVNKLSSREAGKLLNEIRNNGKNVVDDPEADEAIKHTEYELNGNPDVNAKENLEAVDSAEKSINNKKVDGYTKEDVDYEIDNAQLEADYQARVVDNENLQDVRYNEVTEGEKPKKSDPVMNAINEIARTDDMAKNLQICLTGGL